MKKTTVAIALGSGGARGLTQIGALEALEANNFEIVAISGTSIGSLIGGLYASDRLTMFKDWINNLDRSGIYDLVDFTLNTQGFVKGERVFNQIKNFVPNKNIQDLRIPFVAVSADIKSQQEVLFENGDLFDAIRASVAVPSVLTPVKKGHQLLVDGGVVNPLPISALPNVKADLTIAIDLNGTHEYLPVITKSLTKENEKRAWSDYLNAKFSLNLKDYFFRTNSKKKEELSYFSIINSSFDLMQNQLTEITVQRYQPDILLRVPRSSASTFEFYKAEELIEYGRQQMLKELDRYFKNKKAQL